MQQCNRTGKHWEYIFAKTRENSKYDSPTMWNLLAPNILLLLLLQDTLNQVCLGNYTFKKNYCTVALENKNVKCFKMSTKDTRSNLPWTSVGTLLQCGGGTFSHRPTSSSIIGIFLNLVVTTYKSEMMKVWFETNAGAQQFIQWKKMQPSPTCFGYGECNLTGREKIIFVVSSNRSYI